MPFLKFHYSTDLVFRMMRSIFANGPRFEFVSDALLNGAPAAPSSAVINGPAMPPLDSYPAADASHRNSKTVIPEFGGVPHAFYTDVQINAVQIMIAGTGGGQSS